MAEETTITSMPTPAARHSRPSAAHFYRHALGDFEIIVVSDGIQQASIRPGDMRNVPFETYKAALAAGGLLGDVIGRNFHPVVVDTGDKLVLIDTGNVRGLVPGTGKLAAGLAAAGIDRNEIDIVLLTHLDHDHIGGLRGEDNELAFPNAEIKVPQAEWAYFMDEENLARAVTPPDWPSSLMSTRQLLLTARAIFEGIHNRVALFEPGEEVAPGITAVETFGHSPGHVSYLIASGSAQLVVAGDVSANPFTTLRHPNWHPAADHDGPLAEASRRKLFDMIVAERMLVSSYHFPFPSLGHVEREGDGYRFVPLWWNPLS